MKESIACYMYRYPFVLDYVERKTDFSGGITYTHHHQVERLVFANRVSDPGIYGWAEIVPVDEVAVYGSYDAAGMFVIVGRSNAIVFSNHATRVVDREDLVRVRNERLGHCQMTADAFLSHQPRKSPPE